MGHSKWQWPREQVLTLACATLPSFTGTGIKVSTVTNPIFGGVHATVILEHFFHCWWFQYIPNVSNHKPGWKNLNSDSKKKCQYIPPGMYLILWGGARPKPSILPARCVWLKKTTNLQKSPDFISNWKRQTYVVNNCKVEILWTNPSPCFVGETPFNPRVRWLNWSHVFFF